MWSLQLVATGIEDDCILKTCSQRKSTFPRAFAKLSRSFPGVFCWYKMRAQISSRYFVPDRKLVESFSKALRKLLEGTLSCEHVFKMPSPSIPVAISCTVPAYPVRPAHANEDDSDVNVPVLLF